MASVTYQIRVYAPTEGIEYVELYTGSTLADDGEPLGETVVCCDSDEIPNTTKSKVSLTLADGYIVYKWVVTEDEADGTRYGPTEYESDSSSYTYKPSTSYITNAFIRPEVGPAYYAYIEFNSNGGNDDAPVLDEPFIGNSMWVEVTLPDKIPTRDGYTFVEWNTMPDGSGDGYVEGKTYDRWYASTNPEASDATTTLYAIWEQNAVGNYVKIYYDGEWCDAIPWVYNGSQWKEAIPWVYDGSTWQTTG